jgi:DNA-binding beta-propeller fold protein YncE
MVILWRTNSDEDCYAEAYQYARNAENGRRTTSLAPVDSWYFDFDCSKAVGIAKLDLQELENASSIVPQLRTASLAASPGSSLWILSDTAPDSAPVTDDAVYAADPNTGQTQGPILTPGPLPLAIAPGQTGSYVYVALQGVPAGENGIPAHPPLIEAINTSGLSIAQTINLPQGVTPGRPASSPDDRYLYVPATFYDQSAESTEGEVLVVDTQNPSSIVTVPLTISVRTGQSAAPSAGNTVITPDGELLFVLCGAGFCAVDTATDEQIGYVGYGAGLDPLSDIAIDPTGSRLYLAGQTHVYAYDTATLAQTAGVLTKTGVTLGGIGVAPDGSVILSNDQNSTAVFAIDPVTMAVTEVDVAAPPAFPSGETPTSIMVVQ